MADSKAKADAGQAEVEDALTEAQKKGYFGTLPEQPSNEAYSLQSGPESPSALDGQLAHAEARVRAMKEAK